jgi:hypothetical protein
MTVEQRQRLEKVMHIRDAAAVKANAEAVASTAEQFAAFKEYPGDLELDLRELERQADELARSEAGERGD